MRKVDSGRSSAWGDLAGAIYFYVYSVLRALEGDSALTTGAIRYFYRYLHVLLGLQAKGGGRDGDASG